MKLSDEDKKDIIDSALVLRQWRNTKNPFKVAKAMGIKIKPLNNNPSMRGYSYYGEDKKEIWINPNLSYKEKNNCMYSRVGTYCTQSYRKKLL